MPHIALVPYVCGTFQVCQALVITADPLWAAALLVVLALVLGLAAVLVCRFATRAS